MVKFSVNKMRELRELVNERKLSTKAYFVFYVMCEKAITGNKVLLKLPKLAEITNTPRNHIYRYLNELKSLNLISFDGEYYYVDNEIITAIPENTSVLKNVNDEGVFLYSGFEGIFEPEFMFCASHKYIHRFHAFTKEMTTRTLNKKGQELINEIKNTTEHDTLERHLLMLTVWTWHTKEGFDENDCE